MQKLFSGFSTFVELRWLKHQVVLTVLAIGMSSSLFADTRTLLDGQANVVEQFDTIDLDLGGVANADEQRFGARLLLPRFSDHFVLFFDAHGVNSVRNGIALNEEVDASGQVGGGGIFITDLIPDWRNFTVDLRLSGQSETQDVDSNIVVGGVQAQARLKNRNVSIGLLLSPVTPVFDNGANTYISLGASYQRSERIVNLSGREQPSLSRYEQDYVPHLALGIVYPYKRIRLFAGIAYEQELVAGLGVRLQLSRRNRQ